jgi:hypothetical protein
MVYAIEKNMTSISILMLPTSLFDPIHVRFFRLITVELTQSMSTVEYHEVLVHLSHNVKSRKHKDYHTIYSFRNYPFNVSITFLQTLSSFSSSEGIGWHFTGHHPHYHHQSQRSILHCVILNPQFLIIFTQFSLSVDKDFIFE